MKLYKVLWETHKWVGVVSGVVLVNIAVTGFLLLLKKDNGWIQPPTMEGSSGSPQDFITMPRLFSVVLNAGHEDFRQIKDIDRIDFRPGKRVHKVRSRHNHSEIQVDAVTGEVLSASSRRSDLIENLHDGSFFGRAFHGWLMPIAAVSLLFLVASGIYLWIEPIARRWRRRRRRGSTAS